MSALVTSLDGKTSFPWSAFPKPRNSKPSISITLHKYFILGGFSDRLTNFARYSTLIFFLANLILKSTRVTTDELVTCEIGHYLLSLIKTNIGWNCSLSELTLPNIYFCWITKFMTSSQMLLHSFCSSCNLMYNIYQSSLCTIDQQK